MEHDEDEWLKNVHYWYPEVNDHTCFLPPIYYTNVHNTVEALEKYITSIEKEDHTLQLLRCLSVMADESKPKEVMFVISHLKYNNYHGKYSFNSEINFLPHAVYGGENDNDPSDFDILIIHRLYGLIILKMKDVGTDFGLVSMTNEEQEALVVKEVKEALGHLKKAEVVLRQLLSDFGDVSIFKAVVTPYITSTQLLQAIRECQSDVQVRYGTSLHQL